MLRALLLLIAFVPAVVNAGNRKYAEGQVWSYKNRPQDVGSMFKIYKIEKTKRGPIYHISVISIKFLNPGILGVMPHVPFSAQSLDKSAVALVDRPPPFPTSATQDGIDEWRRARGGVYIISIAEAIDIADKMTAAEPTDQSVVKSPQSL